MNNLLAHRAIVLGATLLPLSVFASSHREAPAIAGMPRVDASDFYMFRSYEPGRSNYVTFIANYVPLQDPAGGPNFYNLDTSAVYQINLDRDGDAIAGLQFAFHFKTKTQNLAVSSGGQSIPVPLVNIGQVDVNGANLNVSQSYTLEVIDNGRGRSSLAENLTSGGETFDKPADNIGNKSIPDYEAYASHFVYDVRIPNCNLPGRVFVGQRKEGFVVNLGEVFDLVNLNPAGARDAEPNTLSGKNVTSLALELPISCVTLAGEPVLGATTTASINGSQVSRLGMPLVNELVIGLPDKDKFNSSLPKDDAQFLKYVTNPSLPVLLNVLFKSAALIPETPRNDLVAAFLTGIKGLNSQHFNTPSEQLRLNTSTPVTAIAQQNDLGVLGADAAGFPNGRRPYDDVVDITLRVAEGVLCSAALPCGDNKSDPNHGAPYTDGSRASGPDAANLHVTGAIKAGDTYLGVFPYLNTPIPGSPNGANGIPK